MRQRSTMWALFETFAQIGLFTFGGGYAMISLIEQECIDRRGWITGDELSAMMAIAESTPGPIAINCATYTGYKLAGFAGALAATVGMALPSVVVIELIALFFDQILEVAVIAHAFAGIRVGVGVLIVQAGVNMLMKMKKRRPMALGLLAFGFAGTLVSGLLPFRVTTIMLLVIAAAVSICASLARGKGERAAR